MGDGNLNNKQFVTIALIIILCGIAIIGHNYFMEKKSNVYEQMSILLSQEPDIVEAVTENNEPTNVSVGDTSGRVKKSNVTKINLNRGFVKYGTSGNNVNQNIAIINSSTYPNYDHSNFILAAHSGTGWNAYFEYINELSFGDKAYITYKGKQYEYTLIQKYKDKKENGVTIYRPSDSKQLTLITCKKPDYRKYFLVLIFELTEEKSI